MAAPRTFEERVGEKLDVLYDGALVMTGSDTRAETLVLDVVVSAARAYRHGDRAPDFGKWIVGRLVRQWLEYERDRSRRERLHGPAPKERRPAMGQEGGAGTILRRVLGDDTAGGIGGRRLDALIDKALHELPPERRAAVWLVGTMRFGYGEAAVALGVDRATLRGLLFQGRRELQMRLAILLKENERDGTTGHGTGGLPV